MTKNRISSVSSIINRVESEENLSWESKGFYPKVAVSKKEKEDAYKLANEEYLKKGYVYKSHNAFLGEPYDKKNKTLVLNVYFENLIAGTVTLTSPDSMPCLSLFDKHFKSTQKNAEVCRLAIQETYKNNREVLLLLIDLILFSSVKFFNYDAIYSEVNPRHVKFWEKFLGFKAISDVVFCDRVNNAPAILLRLDLKRVSFSAKRYPLVNGLMEDKFLIDQCYYAVNGSGLSFRPIKNSNRRLMEL